jgi:putative ABC transport system permease protein
MHPASRRSRELAIRAALGASSGVVRNLIMRQGMLLAATGIVLGVMGALAMSTVPLLLFGVALVSSLIPAAVAGRVDPA